MKASPLHLKNYFVTNLSVKANQVMEGSQNQLSGGFSTTTRVEPSQHQQNKRDWRIVLQISCKPEKPNFCTYFVEAELVGFVEVDRSIAEEKIADIVIGNGPALLYGAARELILLVTGRGPFAPVTLPSVTFIDHCPSVQKKLADLKMEPMTTKV